MTDHREMLSTFIRQARSSCVYELRRGRFATNARVQALVRRELLEQRFDTRGLMHGARVWLNELRAEKPAAAEKIERGLRSFRPRAGANLPLLIAGAAAVLIAALLLMLLWGRMRLWARLLFALIGALGAALAIWQLARGLRAEKELRGELEALLSELSKAL